MKKIVTVPLLLLHTAAVPSLARAQTERAVEVRNDSISVRFIDADLRLVVQALARYMDKPVMFGALGEHRVTLEMPAPVPIASIPGVLQGMVTMYGLELSEDDDFYSIRPAMGTPPEPGVAPPLQLYVIKLRHARAADVAATVSALYGVASSLGEPGAPPRTLAESLNDNLIPPAGTDTSAARRPIIGLTAEFAGDVRITPDARTNSLLVRASSRDFELVRAAAEQLDVRPLQVLIEVTIAEIRRDRSLGFGADAVLPRARIKGTTDTDVSGELIGGGLGDFVLKVMDIGGSDLAVVLRAAASRGDVTILSRPVVLAANNEVAEILVGSQRPFVQVQRALPTDAPVRDQVIQFKDVGTRLSVLPTVSDDGYVMLSVTQEVNAATAEVAFDAPVISTRSVRTQLLVKDGRTAVLGGLADRQREATRSGIPILSAIPLIGGLFGGHATHTSETELFVFLTPTVIRSDEELEDASGSVGERTRSLIRKQRDK